MVCRVKFFFEKKRLTIGIVITLEFDLLSCRIEDFKCSWSVKYVGVCFVKISVYYFSRSCLNL